MTQQVLKGLFLVVLILASCSAPSDDGAGGGCGGSDASITCLNVTGIMPTYLDEDTTQCRRPAGSMSGSRDRSNNGD